MENVWLLVATYDDSRVPVGCGWGGTEAGTYQSHCWGSRVRAAKHESKVTTPSWMHIIEIESTYVVACPKPGEVASKPDTRR
jgi:hypothetical protein